MPHKQKDYFLYLPRTPERERWGVEVLGGGFARIPAKIYYPPTGHPTDHSFNYEKGRVLQSLQILCVTEGKGLLKTASNSTQRITAGSVFVLIPGEWHTYRPDPKTGWAEHWIELDGIVPRRLLADGIFSATKCVFTEGAGIGAAFMKIHPMLDGRRHASASELAVAAMELLSACAMLSGGGTNRAKHLEKIAIAERRLSSPIDGPPDLKALARELSWGYSYFRREFKKQTGLSPWQYHLQARFSLAQRSLMTTSDTLEEIAQSTGFGSAFHLSNAFKKAFGKSPGHWREHHPPGKPISGG